MWPELIKAKKNAREVERQIDCLLRNHNSLTRKEISKQSDTLIAEFDQAVEAIKEQLNEFALHMKNHRKHLYSKSRFISRHYSRKASFSADKRI